MVSTPEPNSNAKIIELIQSEIDPKLRSEKIDFFLNSLSPQPNPLYGEIANLLYFKDGEKLKAVTIWLNATGNIIILSDDLDLIPDAIEINNLEAFQTKLEAAFNYQSSVSISHENNQIVSLVRMKQNLDLQRSVLFNGGRPKPIPCPYPYPICPR